MESKKTANCFKDAKTYEYRLAKTCEEWREVFRSFGTWKENRQFRRPFFELEEPDGIRVKGNLPERIVKVSYPESGWEEKMAEWETRMDKITEALKDTQSVCPVCLKTIPARKVCREDGVYLEKTCPEHGDFSALIWEGDAVSYADWNRFPGTKAGHAVQTEKKDGCPRDCGLCEEHRQQICCVLLEVTSRCNLKCPVCFAAAGEETGRDLPLAVIARQYDRLMEAGGPFNIQLSGGEPTMRDDLPEIIRMGREKGFSFFQLNTNGIRLAQEDGYAGRLKEAGLNCVFLQFDGVTEKPYEILRGRPLLEIKKKAIRNCTAAGLGVVLVPVVAPGVNDDQLGEILTFAFANLPYVRGVHFQPVSYFGRCGLKAPERRLTIPAVLRKIEEQTGGRLKAEDFSGGGAENAYCSFHANFMQEEDGAIRALKGGSGACGASSRQSREFVARRWSGVEPEEESCCCCGEPQEPEEENCACCCGEETELYSAASLDDFLERIDRYTLAVSGMLFQDAYTLDLDRLKRCYICEITEEGQPIPFCAYNLTSDSGESLYRNRRP
jgi:uncharacterized radical SAM superfamily Fe-S cluster-containing enzyme